MSGVVLSNLVKQFGAVRVIHGVDLQVEEGEFCVFVGPSGCGKSTLLRMIAGLEQTTSGTIQVGGRDVTDSDPAKRGVAMVFQSYALYPHMTVEQNIGFGLRMGGMKRAEVSKRVRDASRKLQLDQLLDRKPKSLSGGQRQRVAIGRAIVREPNVFLFDEPLSNLDAELRVQMRLEIARLHSSLGATMIYVTHDQTEAMTLADKIVVLRDGRIEQVGSPTELYERPENAFVAGFIGSPRMNFLAARHEGNGVLCIPELGERRVSGAFTSQLPVGAMVNVGVRPDGFGIGGDAAVPLRVEVLENLGGISYAYLERSDRDRPPLVMEIRGGRKFEPGGEIPVSLSEQKIHVFDVETDMRIP